MSADLPIQRTPAKRGGLAVLWAGFSSALIGLTVTLRTLVKPKVTELYPMEKPTLTKAYRSAIALVHFDDIGTHDCIACSACQLICPSDCIELTGQKMPGTKKKRVDFFEVDFSTCSLCGLCLAVCPTDTLKYSTGYDDASRSKEWVHDLLEPFDDPPVEELARRLDERAAKQREARAAARGDHPVKKPARPAPPPVKTEGGDA